jgi:hypothetical protein
MSTTVSRRSTTTSPSAPQSMSAALLSYGLTIARTSARIRCRDGTSIGTSSTRSPDSRIPTGGSASSRTAISSSPRHGPASEGATMSAIEVTVQCSIASRTWPAIVGSKIVTRSGTSASTKRTMSAARSAMASSRDTTATQSTRPPSSAPRTSDSSGDSTRSTPAPAASSARQVSSARSPSPMSRTLRTVRAYPRRGSLGVGRPS